VLVVEDEPDVGELIRYTVTREGYEVSVVRTGTEAIESVRERPTSTAGRCAGGSSRIPKPGTSP
jgi:DNA-binding response OmpR family regulator